MHTNKTKIIFIWHMHQPPYKSINLDYLLLPWVRLRAVKDYWGMAKIVEKFNIKVTFNFSGILLEQLSLYSEKKIKDYYQILTLKNPNYFTYQERNFLIQRFFSVNFENVIKQSQRYLELYNKALSKKPRFSKQELIDLQVLFNLAWFHPYAIREDKNLKYLIEKKQNYNHQDKEYVIKKQYKILSEIFPIYKKLLATKKIELSLSPYYHPIMPLIFDTDTAKEFLHTKVPILRFSSVRDCFWHLKKSKEIFKKIFDYIPVGSWPSEGAVSEKIAKIYSKEKFRWIATDEAILFKSFTAEDISFDRIKNQRHLISQAYKFADVSIFFRDRYLSDLISFSYYNWNYNDAVGDLLGHFRKAHNYLKNIFPERFVAIIMDGENAWEYYKNNGVEFLENLYKNLEKDQDLETTTPAEFLNNFSPKKLERLASGSWINADFSVWIGNKKNNQYWKTLRRIKDEIPKLKSERKEQVRNYLYLLEASDWFWWNTFQEKTGVFNQIFRSYVKKIIQISGKPQIASNLY